VFSSGHNDDERENDAWISFLCQVDRINLFFQGMEAKVKEDHNREKEELGFPV